MIQSKIPPTLLIDLRPHMTRDTRVLAGWVIPGGAYYKGGSWRHDSLAESITGAADGTARLENEGWVRLTDYGHPVVADEHHLTQAQIDALFDLGNLFQNTDFGSRLLSALVQEESE